MLDGLDDLSGIHLCRARRIHVRDDGRHPESRIEEREEREGRKIHFTWPEIEDLTDRLHLGQEVAVAIDDPFWRSG